MLMGTVFEADSLVIHPIHDVYDQCPLATGAGICEAAVPQLWAASEGERFEPSPRREAELSSGNVVVLAYWIHAC